MIAKDDKGDNGEKEEEDLETAGTQSPTIRASLQIQFVFMMLAHLVQHEIQFAFPPI